MSDIEYRANFIDKELLTSDSSMSKQPKWVDSSNSSEAAYKAILSLEKTKKEYIRRNQSRSKFLKKGNYLMNKAEVARLVGVNPQPLFSGVSYGDELTTFFDSVNTKLEEAKANKISKNNGGLRQKTKKDLVLLLQKEKVNNSDNVTEIVDAVYERVLNNLAFDVKKRLGLHLSKTKY
jgi:hypothetical protein